MSIDKRVTEPITTLGFVPGQNLDDSEFTAEELLAAEQVVFEFISARFPQHDLEPESTLYDLFRPDSVIYLMVRRMLETFRATMSLQGIDDNPELADESVVSAILSNYLIARSEGSKTRGTIRISVSSSRNYRIPEATVFTSADGLEFVTESELNASPSGDPAVQDDGGGNFFFDVPVIAAEVGVLYDSASTSQFEVNRTIENLISSNGLGDFAGGEDFESISGLGDRILQALSVRNRISRAAVASELAADQPGVVASEMLGMGDALMLRNRDNALGVATGGVVDVYVRTSLSPQTFEVSKVAELVEGSDDTYSVTLDAADLPGHYRVLSVRPPGAGNIGTYQLISQVRSIEAGTSGKRLPDVPSSAFSQFQATTVTFQVEALDPMEGEDESSDDDMIDVVLEVMAPEGLADLQAWFDDPQQRVVGVDYLVRGFVPCLVSTSAIKVKVEELADVTVSQVRAAVMSVIHLTPSGDGVRVDSIVTAIRAIEGVVEVDLPILLTGNLYTPAADSAIVEFSSESELLAPATPASGYGPDNTVYFTTPERIGVSLQKV